MPFDDDSLTALVKLIVEKMNDENNFIEIYVDTPQKTPEKEAKKYGPYARKKRRSFDAAIIGGSYQEINFYIRKLNYKYDQVVACTGVDFERKLHGWKPDEDFIVHVVGSWCDPMGNVDAHSQYLYCISWLKTRGFEIEVIQSL
jgi:hypothetical protein